MSEHDDKAKCALVQLFAADKDGKIEVGEDGSKKKLAEAYAFFGKLENVDYGDYNGDGFVQLVAGDGKHVSWHTDIEESMGISDAKWKELVFDSGVKIGTGRFVEWAQDSCCDGAPCIVRVSGMADVPEISPEKTINESDLSDAQKHEVKINGKPLFDNGGVTSGGTAMLREDISSMVDGMWSAYVECKLAERGQYVASINIHVADYPSADGFARCVEIKANRKNLALILEALGCVEPDKVRILHSEGKVDGDQCVDTVHFVRLVIADKIF
jgi:hypothetical protein